MVSGRARAGILAALCAACVALTGLAIISARARAEQATRQAPAVAAAGADALAEWRQHPHVIFRSTALDESYGMLAVVPLDQPAGPRYVTSLACTRAYFAAGRGVCLGAQNGIVPTYTVDIFDEEFQSRPSFHGMRLAGPPSRTRVSSNGKYAATTAFAAGDGYAVSGFSTRTSLVDLDSGTILADLEGFTIWRNGSRFQSADFNFWGVTFEPDQHHFYATLGTGGTTYLIEGDLTTRESTVLLENVECPSLSPDGSRLVFKQRVSGSTREARWQLAVLDLATMNWSQLSAEPRDVDDQVEWLDDRHILYGLPDDPAGGFSVTNVWVLDVDEGAPARMFIPRAWSPAVVRP